MSAVRLDQCSCKVGRVIEKYDMSRLDEEIRDRRDRENASLRDLADFVNVRVLRQAIDDHAERDVLADAESIYETVHGEGDSGRAAELRDRLDAVGVPVEEVTGDFVSHQTVRKHLNSCLDVDTARSPTTDVSEATNLIEWARSRDEKIIDRTLTRLRRSGDLDVGELNVIHSIRVMCEDCGRTYRLQSLLDDGGCQCGGRDDAA